MVSELIALLTPPRSWTSSSKPDASAEQKGGDCVLVDHLERRTKVGVSWHSDVKEWTYSTAVAKRSSLSLGWFEVKEWEVLGRLVTAWLYIQTCLSFFLLLLFPEWARFKQTVIKVRRVSPIVLVSRI